MFYNRGKPLLCQGLPKELKIKDFYWADRKYPLRQFLEAFEHYTPFLILVTSGYLGRDEWIHGVASDEMYWLHDVAKQPRVVVRDEHGRYFSVPKDFVTPVVPFDNFLTTIGEPMAVIQALDTAGVKYIQFHAIGKNRDVSFYEDAELGGSMDRGLLEIMDTYDEKFLVVHSLLPEGLHPQHTMIPVYMPIEATVCVSRTDGRQNEFHKNMLEFDAFIKRCTHDYTPILKEVADIMAFEETPVEGDYAYVTLRNVDSDPPAKNKANKDQAKVKSASLPPGESAQAMKKHAIRPKRSGPVPKVPARPGQKLEVHKPTLKEKLRNLGRTHSHVEKPVGKPVGKPASGAFKPPPPVPPSSSSSSDEDADDYEDVDSGGLYPEITAPTSPAVSTVPRGPWYPTSDLNPMKVLQELHETFRCGILPCVRGLLPPDAPLPAAPLPVVEEPEEEEEVDYGPPPPLQPRILHVQPEQVGGGSGRSEEGDARPAHAPVSPGGGATAVVGQSADNKTDKADREMPKETPRATERGAKETYREMPRETPRATERGAKETYREKPRETPQATERVAKETDREKPRETPRATERGAKETYREMPRETPRATERGAKETYREMPSETPRATERGAKETYREMPRETPRATERGAKETYREMPRETPRATERGAKETYREMPRETPRATERGAKETYSEMPRETPRATERGAKETDREKPRETPRATERGAKETYRELPRETPRATERGAKETYREMPSETPRATERGAKETYREMPRETPRATERGAKETYREMPRETPRATERGAKETYREMPRETPRATERGAKETYSEMPRETPRATERGAKETDREKPRETPRATERGAKETYRELPRETPRATERGAKETYREMPRETPRATERGAKETDREKPRETPRATERGAKETYRELPRETPRATERGAKETYREMPSETPRATERGAKETYREMPRETPRATERGAKETYREMPRETPRATERGAKETYSEMPRETPRATERGARETYREMSRETPRATERGAKETYRELPRETPRATERGAKETYREMPRETPRATERGAKETYREMPRETPRATERGAKETYREMPRETPRATERGAKETYREMPRETPRATERGAKATYREMPRETPRATERGAKETYREMPRETPRATPVPKVPSLPQSSAASDPASPEPKPSIGKSRKSRVPPAVAKKPNAPPESYIVTDIVTPQPGTPDSATKAASAGLPLPARKQPLGPFKEHASAAPHQSEAPAKSDIKQDVLDDPQLPQASLVDAEGGERQAPASTHAPPHQSVSVVRPVQRPSKRKEIIRKVSFRIETCSTTDTLPPRVAPEKRKTLLQYLKARDLSSAEDLSEPSKTRAPAAADSAASFEKLTEVPLDITALTVGQVSQCLRLLNMEYLVEDFENFLIDGHFLSVLDETILMEDFGLKRLQAKKIYQFAVHGWRPMLN